MLPTSSHTFPDGPLLNDREVEYLENWLKANGQVTGFLDDFPLGTAKLDPREATTAERDGRAAYVELDTATGKAVPSMRGNTATQVIQALEARALSLDGSEAGKIAYAWTEMGYGIRVYDRENRIIVEEFGSNNKDDPNADPVPVDDENAMPVTMLATKALRGANALLDFYGLRQSALIDDNQLKSEVEDLYSANGLTLG